MSPVEDAGVSAEWFASPNRGACVTFLSPPAAVDFTTYLKLYIISFGKKKSNNARKLNKSYLCIIGLPKRKVQSCTMTCLFLTWFRADQVLPRTSSKASFSVEIFHEVIKSVSMVLWGDW